MPQPEATLRINHSLEKGPGKQNRSAAEGAARKNNTQAAEEIRARRRAIHNQAQVDAAGVDAAPVVQQEQAPLREDVESIEITLRDGRVVEYGPPAGISLSDRITRLFSGRSIQEGGPDPGISEFRLTRVLLGVRSIDGKAVSTVSDLIQRTMLANKLGDEALDLLFYFDRLYWPPLTAAELPQIKKNLRT